MKQPLVLKSTEDERIFFSIPHEVSDLNQSFNGNILSESGNECRIKENIIRYLDKKPSTLTLAQQSNFIPLTSDIYEDTWRKRSIGILSGQDFSIEDEINLLQRWVNLNPEDNVVDIGCSTALYARALAKKQPNAKITALDFSLKMLEAAKVKAKKEDVDLFLLLADAEELPFYSNSMDLVVCGGSLNEFANPDRALYEMKRVLKNDGEVFMMHLLKADTWYGSMLQKTSEIGGLNFWTERESDALFQKAGFVIKRRHKIGIVCFSLLIPQT